MMRTIETESSRSYRDRYTACALQGRIPSDRNAEFGFIGALAILFVASSAVMVIWCRSMSAMGGMPMPGGWTMSMAWMLMPGQTWLSAMGLFLGMWVTMMVAMMLPALTPMLLQYRQIVGRVAGTRLATLTALAGLGYFFVWTAIGLAVFLLGFALSALEMQHEELSRSVPVTVGAIVLAAGAMQFTAWKARCLTCCRETPDSGRIVPASIASAWRHGLQIGVHCGCCCLGSMVILVLMGVMDLRWMAVVTAAITAERLSSHNLLVARSIGCMAVAVGMILMARAAGLC